MDKDEATKVFLAALQRDYFSGAWSVRHAKLLPSGNILVTLKDGINVIVSVSLEPERA